ncbi:MAG: tetratricopeptide repeat protein [Hyphomicrobiales bacterium]
MRTYEFLIGAVLAAGVLAAGPAGAFDGSAATPGDAGPSDAFRIGARAYFSGDKVGALEALRVAAEQGHAAAQWKLGRMYADGDGVPENDQKAFEYFSQVANAHADDNPASPESRYTASAFVALGTYYLNGIRDSAVKPNVDRARQMYSYAASYFGDPDAQYNLARLYLDGSSGEADPMQAARWLKLAAQKGHLRAQVLLASCFTPANSCRCTGRRSA